MVKFEVGQYIQVKNDIIIEPNGRLLAAYSNWAKKIKKGLYILEHIEYLSSNNAFTISLFIRNKNQMNVLKVTEESKILEHIKILPKGATTEVLYG